MRNGALVSTLAVLAVILLLIPTLGMMGMMSMHWMTGSMMGMSLAGVLWLLGAIVVFATIMAISGRAARRHV